MSIKVRLFREGFNTFVSLAGISNSKSSVILTVEAEEVNKWERGKDCFNSLKEEQLALFQLLLKSGGFKIVI
jgi:hypothetical protein